ncbi:hypothetical protein [Anaerococcus vaginalis]|uniref:hypothetical protein n=1 Tax=Anaerococcus vaginalis TaxID=33037 RepID=UPI0029111876|nr:hypothetical protein [Anaerococcus vaginalis]MDU5252921.1 hypothetical protein [Anaerococcus vaginalis]MDU6782393.1 hypothetical protein [Anaerococcus vaginalis]
MDNNLKMFVIGMLAVAIVYSIITFLNFSKEYTKEIKNEKISFALDRLDRIIKRAVGAANQVIVNNAKEDGTFTASYGKKVKEEVMQTVLKILGDEGKQLLNEALGDLDEYISNGIEDEVDKRK